MTRKVLVVVRVNRAVGCVKTECLRDMVGKFRMVVQQRVCKS